LKGLAEAYTIAFYKHSYITTVKWFVTVGPGWWCSQWRWSKKCSKLQTYWF